MKAPLENLIRSAGPASKLAVRDVETRNDSESDTTGRLMVGAPIVFNQWTEINSFWEGHFLERIAPGAVDRTLQQRFDKIIVAFNHGMDPQIGDKPLGKASVIEPRSDHLWTEVPLARTSYNDDLIELLRTGAIWGQSFRFSVREETWEDEPDPTDANPRGLPQRTINELQLYEFGPVTYPAYEATSVGIRTALAYERFLRDRTDAPADPGTSTDATPTPVPVADHARNRNAARVAQILTADLGDLRQLTGAPIA